jgi:signal transduction histidine kinase
MCHHQGMDLPRQASPDVERPAGVVAGVAADVAARLGLDPMVVRLAFVVLTFAGGAGVLLYGLLWLRLTQSSDTVVAPQLDVRGQVGLGVAFAGLLLLLRAVGLWFGDALVLPVALGALGSVLIWTRSAPDERERFVDRLGVPRLAGRRAALPASPAQLVAGIALVAIAMVALVAANDALVAVRDLAVALLAGSIGAVLLFGPWAVRLAERTGIERRARIREEERGEIAAHLHDSVLQTLALIQRSADDPVRMVQLARRQERELRRWLFEGRSGEDATTLRGALESVVVELEADHDVELDLVRVGDAPLDDDVAALVAAVREACTNAARHAGVARVSVFVEVRDEEVVAFVRDRGRGFDAAVIAEDRSGVRHSIVGRLERRGGRAVVETSPGDGCEWELAVPRSHEREVERAVEQTGDGDDAADGAGVTDVRDATDATDAAVDAAVARRTEEVTP